MSFIPFRPILASVLTLSVLLAGCASPAADPADSTPTSTPDGTTPTSTTPTSTTPTSPTPVPPGTTAALGPAPVDLRSAAAYAILAKSGVSTTGTTTVTGDIGASPVDSTAITGFGLVMDASNVFATSALVTGRVYAADYAAPAPTQMTQAISDMETAYNDAAGRTDPTATELAAGSIGGLTLTPGLYKWGTAVTILSDLTLAGGADDVWIFQIAQTLDLASGVKVTLAGGAQAKNVFWQVGDQATLDTTSSLQGNVLSYSAIVLKTGASLDGRALAQTAVTLDASRVTMPAG